MNIRMTPVCLKGTLQSASLENRQHSSIREEPEMAKVDVLTPSVTISCGLCGGNN